MSTTVPPRSSAGGRRRPGRPPQITPEAILDVAERHAASEWTLARVADELGVTSAAIYHYFPGRDAIMKALGRRILAQAHLPPLEGDWRVWLRALARHWYDLAVRHPFLGDADTLMQAFGGSGVEEAQRPIEALVAAGFSPPDSYTAYWLICTTAMEHARAVALWHRRRPELEAHLRELQRRADPLGALVEIVPLASAEQLGASLDRALDMVLAGIEQVHTAHHRT